MAGLPVRGGGKLSLKRRREDRGGALGLKICGFQATKFKKQIHKIFSTKTSWFENQELSDAETSWISLLRTVDPHLNRSSLEKFVSFPKFHPKNSQIANPQPCLETFNCGTKTFEWVPLPVYHRDWKAADSGRRQNSASEKIIPAGENDPEEAPKAISLVPKQKSQTAKGYKVGDTKGGVKYSIRLEDEGFEMR